MDYEILEKANLGSSFIGYIIYNEKRCLNCCQEQGFIVCVRGVPKNWVLVRCKVCASTYRKCEILSEQDIFTLRIIHGL